MQDNVEITWTNPLCVHHDGCGCKATVKTLSPEYKGKTFTSSMPTIEGQYSDIISQMNTFVSGKYAETEAELEDAYIRAGIRQGTDMKLIDPPFVSRPEWPESIPIYHLSTAIHRYVRKADTRYLFMKIPQIRYTDDVLQKAWTYTSEVPSLLTLCIRMFSSYHSAFGKTNGRPHVVSTADGLYTNHKLANTIINMQRPLIGDAPVPIFENTKEIMRHYYRIVGADYRRKEKYPLSAKYLNGMYLGSAGGIVKGPSWTIRTDTATISVNPKGKKSDLIEQDLSDFLEYIKTGKEPAIYFGLSIKNEYAFSFTKQWNDEQWLAFEQKVRLFVIPSSLYIIMERMVGYPRMMRERGPAIRIGHIWAYGGADTIAKILLVYDNPYAPVLVGGDITGLDLGVLAADIDLYWSTHLVYHDETDDDFPIIKEITKFLCKTQLMRITRLAGDIWAAVRQKVPSGQLDTSHQDSFVMLKYWIGFCLWTIITGPKELREDLETLWIDLMRIVVYGDDHIYNKQDHKHSHYFSGHNFALWLKRYFNVEVRDLEDGVPFLSEVKDGYLVKRGITFLRYQFVLNPYYNHPNYPGQSKYIPFRETREIMIRVVYAREAKHREPFDILISIISHAYGTYGSNKDAYDRLMILYNVIYKGEGYDMGTLGPELLRRAQSREMGKLRQLGITAEEISKGFPTWDMIIRKNVYRAEYQDNSREYFCDGDDYSMDDW